ncbi:50S ribosomal protein L9 [Stackebrandtia nassauensis]|uniref:Large ribosomal subunit protein bL9 n=1 Tax=Stackebrandtia nassauensis (strain DSM 44728 / CIP 108903 / NRRL B-16338 / NBRC 102104 / LLR-40K-21) TaxID=446470 RepID=D3Q1K3_STANL|nr:50S ribosomal protein L9 [Stackebrandtia nassauensis]ADD39851.1 ribosomal protein L9 [Stackebrandtia nassauensis DSM 44728]
MKLILTREVSGLGEPGDVVEVKNGYGRNYLIPQRFATPWTKGGQKQVDQIKRARTAREVRDADHAREIHEQLAAVNVKLTARAGTGGRLFGSITPAEITDAVEAAGGPKLDRRRLELPGHIKAVGSHEVAIKLHPEVRSTFKIEVVAAK